MYQTATVAYKLLLWHTSSVRKRTFPGFLLRHQDHERFSSMVTGGLSGWKLKSIVMEI